MTVRVSGANLPRGAKPAVKELFSGWLNRFTGAVAPGLSYRWVTMGHFLTAVFGKISDVLPRRRCVLNNVQQRMRGDSVSRTSGSRVDHLRQHERDLAPDKGFAVLSCLRWRR